MPKKFMMQHRIGGMWLVVEGHVDADIPDSVLVSLREDAAKGVRRPGPRRAFQCGVGRAQLLGLAYDLIDVAEALLPETAMNSSEVIAKGGALPVPCNKRFADGAREHGAFRLRLREEGFMAAFARIRARMPILQRAQRVLERCDAETAHWIEDALLAIERTGRPPVFAWVAPKPPPPDPVKPRLLARFVASMRGRPAPSGSPENPPTFRGAPTASSDPNDVPF